MRMTELRLDSMSFSRRIARLQCRELVSEHTVHSPTSRTGNGGKAETGSAISTSTPSSSASRIATAPGLAASIWHSVMTACGTRTSPSTLGRSASCPTRPSAIRGPASATTDLPNRRDLRVEFLRRVVDDGHAYRREMFDEGLVRKSRQLRRHRWMHISARGRRIRTAPVAMARK